MTATDASAGIITAAVAELVLLTTLWAAAGLGIAGWLGGVVFTAGLVGLLASALARSDRHRLGPADVVTLCRALLVALVAALVADRLAGASVPVGVLVAIALVAVVLDGVDGQVARRTRTATPLGARFDMEVDAALIMILSAYAATVVGPWALAIGLMRYAFVAAGWALPWLRGPLPPSYRAKTIAVVQGAALIAVPVLPPMWATAVAATALLLLAYSFGCDVQRLHAADLRHPPAPSPRAHAA